MGKIGNRWLIIFIILLVITIIFLVLSFFIGDPHREFVQQVSIVLIPIVAGGAAAKFTTSSWQITKEKISIKRKILSDYEESYKHIGLLLENFIYQVIKGYVVYQKDASTIDFDDYSNSELTITAYLKFPQGENNPYEKFKSEYKNLQNDMRITSFIQNRLFSSIRLYYGDESLQTSISKLEKTLNMEQDLVQRFIYSADANELLERYKLFQTLNKKSTQQMKSLENYMIDLPFREISI